MAKIVCKDLSFFTAERKIIDNVNFQFSNGINCLAGENGSGKSMILKCIIGAIKFSGDIFLDEKSIKDNKKLIFENIGFIPPDPRSSIIGETGIEDVLFSIPSKSENSKIKALESLKSINAENIANSQVDFMSTGELRKISIASQLVLSRDVILLDEPFSGLDYKSSLSLVKVILSLKKLNKTILIVSHTLDRFLYYVDNLIILNNGRVVKEGKPIDLLDDLEPNNIHRPYGTFKDMKWI